MNKKGIFTIFLAFFLLVAAGLFMSVFNSGIIKERTQQIGETSKDLINLYTQQEIDVFVIQENAKLAACNALQKSLEKGLLADTHCFDGEYAIWNFNIGTNCYPDLNNIYKKELEKSFKERVKDSNYQFSTNLNEDNIKIEGLSDNFPISRQINKLEVTYNINKNFITEITYDHKKLQETIDKAEGCSNKKEIEECAKSSNFQCEKSDSLIRCNTPIIKNPCTDKDISIKFALKLNSNVA